MSLRRGDQVEISQDPYEEDIIPALSASRGQGENQITQRLWECFVSQAPRPRGKKLEFPQASTRACYTPGDVFFSYSDYSNTVGEAFQFQFQRLKEPDTQKEKALLKDSQFLGLEKVNSRTPRPKDLPS